MNSGASFGTVVGTTPSGQTFPGSIVTINTSNGQVTFVTPPNFEAPADNGANNVYDIVVHANDGLHDTTQAVAITVTDVNEAPVAANDILLTNLGGTAYSVPEWAFLTMLRDEGRSAAEAFLTAHAADLGRRSSINLDVLLEGV